MSKLKEKNTTISQKIFEDEKGKYKLVSGDVWQSCGCHPETCSHENGGYYITIQEKRYEKNN